MLQVRFIALMSLALVRLHSVVSGKIVRRFMPKQTVLRKY
jgi:hypothetical protein